MCSSSSPLIRNSNLGLVLIPYHTSQFQYNFVWSTSATRVPLQRWEMGHVLYCCTSFWRIGVQGIMAMEMRGRKHILYRNNGTGAVQVLYGQDSSFKAPLRLLSDRRWCGFLLSSADLLHSFLIFCSIGSPYFLFASFLSRGCVRVRFLRLNFLF